MDLIRKGLNSRQREVFDFWIKEKPIYSILHGSVRSGKSYLNHVRWLLHVASFQEKGRNFIMTGNTMSSLQKNVLDDMSDLFDIDTHLDKNNSFDLFGQKMRCFGTDKCDSYKAIKGFTSYGWYANEMNLSHWTAVEESITRCSGTGAMIIGDCNPDNPNHKIKTDIIDKSGLRLESGQLLYDAHHFTLDDNPDIPDQYKEMLKRTLTGIAYDRNVKGLWVAREGIIYDCFIESQMTIEQPDLKEISEFFCGVDWGFKHYGVIVLFGVWKEKIIILDIIKEREKDIEWWVDQKAYLQSKYPCSQFYCDTARPEYVARFRGIEADKSVIEGIDKVYSMLKNGQLLISEKCVKMFADELYQYRWRETGFKEEPIKEKDDIMDAIRYALYTKFGKVKKIKEITAGVRI